MFIVFFHDYNILKFCDIVNIEVCTFVNNCFNRNTFSVFAERFIIVSESHARNTRSSSKGLLFVPSYSTSKFRKKSVFCFAALIWNHLQSKYSNHEFMKLAPKVLKIALTQKLICLYCEQQFCLCPRNSKNYSIVLNFAFCSIFAESI